MNKMALALRRKRKDTFRPYSAAGIFLTYQFVGLKSPSMLFIEEKRQGKTKFNFPLGKIESRDSADAITTALREFHEETNGLLYCFRDYLECKLRAEYPNNALYVKSGNCYMFFVELPKKLGVDDEMADLKGGTALEDKIREKMEEVMNKFHQSQEKAQIQSTSTADTKIQEPKLKTGAEPAPDSQVQLGEETTTKPDQSEKKTEAPIQEQPAAPTAEESSPTSDERKEEAPTEDKSAASTPQELSPKEEDLLFTKRQQDKDNQVRWVQSLDLLREQGKKPGSEEEDDKFHRFTCSIIYHPIFQQKVTKRYR